MIGDVQPAVIPSGVCGVEELSFWSLALSALSQSFIPAPEAHHDLAAASAPGPLRTTARGARTFGLVTVKIEEVAVQILYGELPQSPRLFFQRIHDVRT